MSLFEQNKVSVDNLFNSLSPYIEREVYYNEIHKIMDKHDIEGAEISWEKSVVRRLFQAYERFRLVKHLRVQKDTLRTAQGNSDSNEKDFAGYMYPALCTYLLLTCFDQLGQPEDGFLTFQSWLGIKKDKGKGTKNERECIIKQIEGLSNIDFTKKLYEEYNKIYSVKRSFYKFINLILTDKQKQNLLNQILIREYDKNGNLISQGSEDDKKNWLYEVRNNYTHNTYSTETSFYEGDNIEDRTWYIRKKISKNGNTLIIYVSDDFNNELEKSVLIGITEKIKKNGENTEGAID